MWWKTLLFVILGLAIIVAVALAFGSSRWQAATRQMHAELDAPPAKARAL